MTEYREILRLHALGFSQRNIANSCHASKTTVSHVLKKAKELGISWPLDENQTNGALKKLFSSLRASLKPLAHYLILPISEKN